ncbi:MAG: type I phosphomannose isomerase catalytic subunit [Myxococcota bacterium]
MTTLAPYVMRSAPHFVRKVWGGRKLATAFHKRLPDDARYGESWEVADLPSGASRIANGSLAGRTLTDAVALLGDALLGTHAPNPERFPLLVKLLDARDDLSVQVHPGERHLHLFEGARSKDECWLILHADPGASVLHGCREPMDRATFARRATDGTLVDALRRVPVSPGDVLRIAPGTVHSICAGVALLEIQQPSNTTFRLYDYQRPGLDGRMRPLHLQEGCQVCCMEQAKDQVTLTPTARDHDGVEVLELVTTPSYCVEALTLPDAPMTWRIAPQSVQVVYIKSGTCVLGEERFTRGETAILPASLGSVRASGPGAALVVSGVCGPLVA